jgi:carbonic anhydrase
VAEYPETPDDALRLLVEGNERWQRREQQLRSYTPVDRHELEQKPFAAVLTCSDSRLSTTLIFDLHRGNLFVARVAGNTAAPAVLGSIEFAVAVLEVRLVLVLGHTNCGAVGAAVEVAEGRQRFPRTSHGAIGDVVDPIVPIIEALPDGERTADRAVEGNARAQARAIAASEPIVAPAVAAGRVKVVAAVYRLENGSIDLL